MQSRTSGRQQSGIDNSLLLPEGEFVTCIESAEDDVSSGIAAAVSLSQEV